jgi:general secretion pathway protein A
MYMEIYGLREQPFGVSPNPRFLYFSALHKNALTSLVHSVCERRGFSALIAKPGMGKTTLIMQLLSLLRDSARTGFLFQSHGSTQEFLAALLQDIDATPASYDLVDMQKALNAVVLREARANRQLVIVVDEAQNLPDETLEAIRLLSNFENPEAKLLHIVLAGQPPLADKLAAPHLAQLRQRLAVVAHLSPFNREQVAEYIQRRLEIAGRSEEALLFAQEALEFIAHASEGIPRNINNLCFHALSLGYAAQRPVLDLSIAQQAARALDLKGGSGALGRRFAAAAPAPVVSSTAPVLQQQPARGWARTAQTADSFGADGIAPVTVTPQRKWSKSKSSVVVFAGAVMLVVLLRAGFLPAQMFAYFAHPHAGSSALAGREKTPVAGTSQVSGASPSAPIAKPDAEAAVSSPTPNFVPVHSPVGPAAAESTTVHAPAATQIAENVRVAHAHHAISKRNSAAMPSNVEVGHTETIFEFAMEHCGKADHATIEAIRVANPQIGDIYETLQKGQAIAVPAIAGNVH